ncbi:MAG: serine/threonine-protein kinase, partial [Planctomycetota bacterium]
MSVRASSLTRCPHCGQALSDADGPDAAEAPATTGDELATGETVTLDLSASSSDAAPPASSGGGPQSDAGASAAGAGSAIRSPGETFGEYRIVREIARGGMGIVYLAEQPKLRRTVALKVLRAGEGATEEDFSRFLREAEAAASLSHRNIVPIHELDVQQGRPFFTMDYIDGPSLEQEIAEGKLSLRESVEILEEVALAIHYAHGKGIIHRDLKPANVIIAPDGTPMITDFGLAVNLSRDPATQRMTHSGVVMGTIPYIPPEQAAGDVDRVNPASDIYSLGAVLYELITGQPPFQGETQFELLHCVIHRDPAPPRKLNAKIPADLQTICLKCLEKPQHRRYRTAQELAEDCRAFLDREMIKARPATFWYRVWRTLSRHRSLSLLGTGVILLALAVLASRLSLESTAAEARKSRAEAEIATRALARTREDYERLKEKTEELTATLNRGWRTVLYERFPRLDRRRWSVTAGAASFERGYLALRGPTTLPAEGAPPRTVNAALQETVPGDCQVEFQVYVPRQRDAAVGVLLSGQRLQLAGNFGYLVTVGPPSAPGVRIEKGPVTLAHRPDAALAADRWQTLRIERSSGDIAVVLDDEELLRIHDETPLRGDEYGRIGFLAEGGFAFLDDVLVSIPGSSLQMLTGMLDMADSLYRQGRRDQLNWAIEMAEQVAEEAPDPVLQLRAVRRCITAYLRLHNNLAAAERRLDRLAHRL